MLSQDEIKEIKRRSANCDGIADASVKRLLSHIAKQGAENALLHARIVKLNARVSEVTAAWAEQVARVAGLEAENSELKSILNEANEGRPGAMR